MQRTWRVYRALRGLYALGWIRVPESGFPRGSLLGSWVNRGNPLPIDVRSSGKAPISPGIILRKALFNLEQIKKERRRGGTCG